MRHRGVARLCLASAIGQPPPDYRTLHYRAHFVKKGLQECISAATAVKQTIVNNNKKTNNNNATRFLFLLFLFWYNHNYNNNNNSHGFPHSLRMPMPSPDRSASKVPMRTCSFSSGVGSGNPSRSGSCGTRSGRGPPSSTRLAFEKVEHGGVQIPLIISIATCQIDFARPPYSVIRQIDSVDDVRHAHLHAISAQKAKLPSRRSSTEKP